MLFTPNLRPFFNPNEFAESWTVGGLALYGIFRDGYAEADDIEGDKPTLGCLAADLPSNLAQGSTAVGRGKTYSVCGIRPMGDGVTMIDLEYVSG
jgi:hypothetical protein